MGIKDRDTVVRKTTFYFDLFVEPSTIYEFLYSPELGTHHVMYSSTSSAYHNPLLHIGSPIARYLL